MRHPGSRRPTTVLGLLLIAGALIAAGCAREPSVTAFCEQVAGLGDLDASLSGDPATLDTAAKQLTLLAESAPTEVRGDVETLARALDTMSEAAVSAGGDEAEAIDAALRALEPDVAALEAASASLGNYVAVTCGLPLGAGNQTTTVPPAPFD